MKRLCLLVVVVTVLATRGQAQHPLGERYNVLMSFSMDELEYALRLKLQTAYEGAVILSAEDEPTYLGTITNKFKRESIFNDVGPHGSEVARDSIWNDVGRYGGEVSLYSAYSKTATRPPYVVKDGKVLGRLTVNPLVRGRIDPSALKFFFDD